MRSSERGARRSIEQLGPTMLLLIVGSLPLWAGCDGCRGREQDPAAADPAAPATAYTFGGAQPMPQGSTLTQGGVKPGHWFTVTETIRSNHSDQRGLLRHGIELVPPRSDFEALRGPPDALTPQQTVPERVPLQSERPAVLPKGDTKRLDSRLLAGSPRTFQRGANAMLSGQFVGDRQAAAMETGRQSVSLLQPQEYFFIILTKRPERFSWTQTADWVRPPLDDTQFNLDIPVNYRLVFPPTDRVLALPETMLDWTSTAVLLWDDLAPEDLTPEQGRALLDWVHFGGRLIVNGPAAGVELSRGLLEQVMPLEVQGSGELQPAAIEELLRRWSVLGDTTTDQQIALVRDRSARLVADGQRHPAAVAIDDTAEMVLTRQAGRGQVVLTRFDLTSDWLRDWRSRDSFFNAALLGRPGRNYVLRNAAVTQQYINGLGGAVADASLNTSFRLLARDARLMGDAAAEFASHPTQGLGGWRDDSDAASLVLQTLRSESGVAIPPRRFVSESLAIYLLILVPLNYLLFRLLGRLEWAWLAVPVIGLVGAAWIARGASLDVGFARSRTEIALVELQPGYARGHVTRFISLYNSLSRRYDFEFDSLDAAAAPLGILGQVAVADDQRQEVTLQHGYAAGPTLADVEVASNRTRIFHAEQIIDFGGTVELQDDWLRNNSSLDLKDAWIVRKDDAGQVQVAALGHCDAGSRSRVRWSDEGAPKLPESLPLQAQQLLEPLGRGEPLAPGSMRLIARCEQAMPGLTIAPAAAQNHFATIVVAHLAHRPAAIGDGDRNLLPDRLEKQKQLLQEDELDY